MRKPTRRTFLKLGTVTGAGLLAAGDFLVGRKGEKSLQRLASTGHHPRWRATPSHKMSALQSGATLTP